jgi:hypothetical protein
MGNSNYLDFLNSEKSKHNFFGDNYYKEIFSQPQGVGKLGRKKNEKK